MGASRTVQESRGKEEENTKEKRAGNGESSLPLDDHNTDEVLLHCLSLGVLSRSALLVHEQTVAPSIGLANTHARGTE